MNRGCRLVFDVLEKSDRILTAQEIYDYLRQNEDKAPGLTTVYRALDNLCAMEKATVFNTGDGERRYTTANDDDHLHHIICSSCYLTIPIAQCNLIENAEYTASDKGFVIESHVVEFYGKCADCKDSEEKSKEQMNSLALAGSTAG